jgi:hypothetical protein
MDRALIELLLAKCCAQRLNCTTLLHKEDPNSMCFSATHSRETGTCCHGTNLCSPHVRRMYVVRCLLNFRLKVPLSNSSANGSKRIGVHQDIKDQQLVAPREGLSMTPALSNHAGTAHSTLGIACMFSTALPGPHHQCPI